MIGKIKGIKSSGLDVNGITEEYQATGNINKGNFVKSVNDFDVGTETNLRINYESTYLNAVAIAKISESKVLVLNSNNYFTFATIYNINNKQITQETSIKIPNIADLSETNITRLSNNKFLVTFISSQVYGLILSINENEITIGDLTTISYTTSNSGLSTIILSENKILLIRATNRLGSSNGRRLVANICIINENIITNEIEKTIYESSTVSNIAMFRSAIIKLSTNKIAVLFDYNTRYNLYGIICTISNTTITTGELQLIDSTNDIAYNNLSATLTFKDEIFITCGYNALNAIVCKIEENNILIQNKTQLSTNETEGVFSPIIKLNNNLIFIAHRCTKEGINAFFGMICEITEGKIKIKNDILFLNNNTNILINIIELFNDKLLINGAYSTIVLDILTYIDKISLNDNIYGIAQSNGNNGQTVKIVRPNYNESEEN